MVSTGVAVFAYDRPNHFERVLDGLRRNDVDHLYVFIDGPQSMGDETPVTKVREIADGIAWCDTTVEARDRNLGVAKSIIAGVDRVFEDHDRIVVLEDDCVPASSFVSFARSALERYEDDTRVMNVNGYAPPIDIPDRYTHDVYFTYRCTSWGWGTWRDAWKDFEYEPLTHEELRSEARSIKRKTRKGGRDIYPMMVRQLRGEIDSWAVWWAYAIIANDGVCLNPVRSKIRNIGHDGSGRHSGESTRYDVSVKDDEIEAMSWPETVSVDDQINARYNRFIGGGRWRHLKRRVAWRLKSLGVL